MAHCRWHWALGPTILLLVLAAAGMATGADVHPLVRAIDEQARGDAGASLHSLSAHDGLIECFVRTGDRDALRGAGVATGASVSGMITARFQPGRLGALAKLPGVEAIYPSYPLESHNDVGTASDVVAGVFLGIDADRANDWGYTGRGVLIGVVDSGIDVTHGDFVWDDTEGGPNPVSRIVSIWDQTLSPQGNEAHPGGYGYGVEYDHDDINRSIGGGGVVRTRDTGHGSHVAGIAAGDGSDSDGTPPAGTYRGVAYEAELVVVKTTYSTAAVVDACHYIFGLADALDRPCVINLSLGNQVGPHDGRQPGGLGETLSTLVAPGRLIVASVGNERGDGQHVEGTLTGPGTLELRFAQVEGYEQTQIDLWHHADEEYLVAVTLPTGVITPAVDCGESMVNAVYDRHRFTILNACDDTMRQLDGDKNIQIMIGVDTTPQLDAGTWKISLARTVALGNGQVDGWFWTSNLGGTWVSPTVPNRELISNPANGDSIVAVAGYTTKTRWEREDGGQASCCPGEPLGDVAVFSNPGPLRRGSAISPNYLQTPDISAPCQAIASARSRDSLLDSAFIVADGRHEARLGTSMAAPYVTGAVALAMNTRPQLTLGHLRRAFRNNIGHDPLHASRLDDMTQGVPNDDFGYGKIGAAGLIDYLNRSAVTHWSLYP